MRRCLIVGTCAIVLCGCGKPESRNDTAAAPAPAPAMPAPAPAAAPTPAPAMPPPAPTPVETPTPVDSSQFIPRAQVPPSNAAHSRPQPPVANATPVQPEPSRPTPSPSRPAAQQSVVRVPVFYATDRNVEKQFEFTVDRYGTSVDNDMEFGKVIVSVPIHAHEVGEIERPFKIFGFQIEQEDPEKHFTIVKVTPMLFVAWKLAARQQVLGSEQKQALVYIHGFKKNFEDAAYRTAQLGIDLQIGRESLFMFSWPSKNSVTGYASDEETVKLCVQDLNRFLKIVLDSTGAKRVSVIAHSMGSRLLAAVLEEFKTHPPAHMPTEVVFAAPDINAEEFRRVIEPNIRGTSGRLTVYTSEHDQALRMSKKEHGYPRLGEGGPSVFSLAGFDKIDVTDVDLDLLGHGYYAQTQKVVEDIKKLMLSSLGPDKRSLVPYGRFPRTWRMMTQ